MKPFLTVTTLVIALLGQSAVAAQTARARMYCASLQFHRAEGGIQNLYELEFTTLQFGVNGELGWLGEPYTHWAWLEMTDWIFEETIGGTLNLNKPAYLDGDGNGFDDFYEAARPVLNRSSSGFCSMPGFASGSVSATWNRAAGSTFGTCTLTLPGAGTFTHTFRLIEYTGTVSYTPGATTVSSVISLERTESPEETFGGVLNFLKSTATPFNVLTNQESVWTNAWDQEYEVWANEFRRGTPSFPTNYHGYIEFKDGNPNTGEDDYYLWILSIHDLNDADHDGIPDFSDTPSVSLPRAPQLSLFNTGTNLLLSISGDAGRVHQLQTSTNAAPGSWLNGASVSLTNDPHRLLIPYPSGQLLWRAVAQ